jgi:agmatinase
MDFPDYFADCDSSFEDSNFVIFGVPFDQTSTFRKGAKNAPKKIREASWNFESFNLKNGVDLTKIKIHDYGDLDVNDDTSEIMSRKTLDLSRRIIKKNKFPIAIGGEHFISTGIINAFPSDIGVLFLDAHLDFRNDFEGDPFNHSCVIKRVSEHIGVKNIAVIGIRSADKEEYIEAKNLGLYFRDSFTIKNIGIIKIINELKEYFSKKKIYLSLDIDVLDPAYAPGTSNPEPFGLSSFDVLKIIEEFAGILIGFDLVEVCPFFDKGETAIISAKYIRFLIENVWLNNVF